MHPSLPRCNAKARTESGFVTSFVHGRVFEYFCQPRVVDAKSNAKQRYIQGTLLWNKYTLPQLTVRLCEWSSGGKE